MGLGMKIAAVAPSGVRFVESCVSFYLNLVEVR